MSNFQVLVDSSRPIEFEQHTTRILADCHCSETLLTTSRRLLLAPRSEAIGGFYDLELTVHRRIVQKDCYPVRPRFDTISLHGRAVSLLGSEFRRLRLNLTTCIAHYVLLRTDTTYTPKARLMCSTSLILCWTDPRNLWGTQRPSPGFPLLVTYIHLSSVDGKRADRFLPPGPNNAPRFGRSNQSIHGRGCGSEALRHEGQEGKSNQCC